MLQNPIIKKGYKQTEIGVIPEDWDIININKYSTLKARIGWQALTTNEYLKVGDYFLVTGTDFLNGRVNWDSCNYVTKWRYDQDKNIQIKNGDILVTKDGTIGKVGYVEKLSGLGTLNSGIFVIRPIKETYLPLFLFYILSSRLFDDFLNKITAGSTITHLYQKDFIGFNFPNPPIIEQSAIASILSDTDALIESLDKLIEKKKAIKQGTMQELLTGKRRLPGFSGEWKPCKLGDIAGFYKGKGLPKSSILESGKYKCIHYGELFTHYGEEIQKIKSFTNDSESLFYSRSNDVLMPTSDVTPNGLAKASAVMEDGVILGGDVMIIRTFEGKVNGTFLSYSIRFDKDKIMQLVSGSTVYHLYGSDMKKYEFKLPPSKDEQDAIVKILNEMNIEIVKLENKRNKLQSTKQCMMQQLLTGNIRVYGK